MTSINGSSNPFFLQQQMLKRQQAQFAGQQGQQASLRKQQEQSAGANAQFGQQFAGQQGQQGLKTQFAGAESQVGGIQSASAAQAKPGVHFAGMTKQLDAMDKSAGVGNVVPNIQQGGNNLAPTFGGQMAQVGKRLSMFA